MKGGHTMREIKKQDGFALLVGEEVTLLISAEGAGERGMPVPVLTAQQIGSIIRLDWEVA